MLISIGLGCWPWCPRVHKPWKTRVYQKNRRFSSHLFILFGGSVALAFLRLFLCSSRPSEYAKIRDLRALPASGLQTFVGLLLPFIWKLRQILHLVV